MKKKLEDQIEKEEEKKKRLAEEKERCKKVFLDTGDEKMGVLSQHFSSVDAIGGTGNVVCILGGFVGEFILTISCL